MKVKTYATCAECGDPVYAKNLTAFELIAKWMGIARLLCDRCWGEKYD